MKALTSKTLGLPIWHIANFKLVPLCLHMCWRNIPMRQRGQRRDTKLVYTCRIIIIIIMLEQAGALLHLLDGNLNNVTCVIDLRCHLPNLMNSLGTLFLYSGYSNLTLFISDCFKCFQCSNTNVSINLGFH